MNQQLSDPLVNKSFKMRQSMVKEIKRRSRESGVRELHMAHEAFAQYFATNFKAMEDSDKQQNKTKNSSSKNTPSK